MPERCTRARRYLAAVLVVGGCSLLSGLGVWQLQRAAEKQALLDLAAQRGDAPSVALEIAVERTAGELNLRKVTARGTLDAAHQLLLDNRTRGGQPGYEVLVPLRLAGARAAVLVNRGWVERGQDRRVKPDVALVPGDTLVRGTAVSLRPGFHLGAMLEAGDGWPRRVQFLQREQLQTLLGYPLLPVLVRIDSGEPLALRAGWTLLPAGPERHYGYALQWFALAVAMLIVFFLAGRRRR